MYRALIEPLQEMGKLFRGRCYGFDLIAHVGVETYLQGRSLQDVREELARRRPAVDIPLSSLWDQQQRFLFYLGCLHRQATPVLREYLAQHGPVTWLLDGTTEPETAVFLGIEEAAHGLFLGNWKIPSENLEDMVPCLREAADRFGRPDNVLHDLSPAMSGACEQALPGVSHFVCHQHLARDVGEDLYEAPQAALCQRLRTLKLQYRLKEQRRGQNEWLRQRIDSPSELVLADLLAGRAVEVAWDDTLGREVLLAFHFWILDYRSDGRRHAGRRRCYATSKPFCKPIATTPRSGLPPICTSVAIACLCGSEKLSGFQPNT